MPTNKTVNSIRPYLSKISAYKVPPSKGFVKLDAMENPHTLPTDALDDIFTELKKININRYPDSQSENVKSALYKSGLVPKDLPMIIGNGSDELIWLLHTLIPEKSKVLALEPSFSMYELNAKICGHEFLKVDLNADFSLPSEELLTTIKREKPQLVWLCYPNNPTGNLFSPECIRKIVNANDGFTVIDEAYLAFVNNCKEPTLINLIYKNERIIILRTLSKMGLAGLRMGYLIAQQTIINEVEKIRLPYNVDRLSAEITNLILSRYHNVLLEQTMDIVDEREKQIVFFEKEFSQFNLELFPSKTNFLLIRHQNANLLFKYLHDNKILIKNFSETKGLLKNCLRITIGKPSENKFLREVMMKFFIKYNCP